MNGQRSEAEITRLLIRHRTSLYSWIYACVRNHTDADDLFQNVSVAVVESFAQLKDEDGFLPWAREIARRRILDYFKKKNREQVIDPGLVVCLAEAAQEIDALVPVSDHREALQACLEKLPETQRRAILMRYDGSVSGVEELAERLGRTPAAMYGVIKRIKVILRDCVERRLGGEC